LISSTSRKRRLAFHCKNHANAIVACDFCTVVTMNFRVLYVFVLIEHGTRRLIHTNVTENPTADWARQQLREAVPSDHEYQYLIHDGDCIFSKKFDATVCNLGIKPIKTPYRSPKANAICERLIGTMRRECLDYVIPLTQNHLKKTLRHWTAYYNRSRPHSSIGPDIPCCATTKSRGVVRSPVNFKSGDKVVSTPIFGGLHHDYRLMCA